MKRYLIPCMVMALSACSTIYPPHDTSTQNRINDELRQATEAKPKAAAPLPEAVSRSLLPPLRVALPKAGAAQLEQHFDLVVNDAPIDQVLTGIVSGTRYSMLVQPKSAATPRPAAAGAQAAPEQEPMERISVNLKDVTVFEALDAIREMYGYDYTLDGTRIYVRPPELQTRLYHVNYILGQRRGVSDLQVIGGASIGSSNSSSGSSGGTTGNSGSSSSGSSSSNYASVQASALSTIAKADPWGEVEDALRTVLGCQIPKKQAERGGTGGAGGVSGGSSSNSSNSGNASRADVSFQGDTQMGERVRGVDGCTDGRAMNINPMSGTILVRAMPKELRVIEKLLRSMQMSIERQVIIEAKIIDVTLNKESQQGINWSVFQRGVHRFSVGADTTTIDGAATNGGAVTSGSSLGAALGTGLVGATGGAFAAGLGVALQLRNFSALINFLQTQGEVHVLSSPRIATLNNQKAVIKVGSEESFVTNARGGSVTPNGTSAPTVENPTITYQPFFAGISLDVTPQIDETDNITLHVHSMVNKITEKEKLAIISSFGDRSLPFAVNSISETDSLVKTRDGQVVVIGGLMTESAEDARSKIPGVGDSPASPLFRKGAQNMVKRELVILLKPTVVRDDSTAWADDIAATQGRLEGMSIGTPAQGQ